MTLSKQIIFIVVGAMLAICMTTFLVMAHQTKNYFEEQLNRNSQDTATSLGLSLSEQVGKTPDIGIIVSKVDAIFDRGYFSRISVEDVRGKVLVNRYLKSNHETVPHWFVALVDITSDKKTALIMQGWRQFGEVTVQSDSALAYGGLWRTIQQQFVVFLGITILIILISVGLIKILFRPLNSIIKQAQDIGQKHFYTLDKVPRVKELRDLSTSINTMVLKLKRFFKIQIEETEQLRSKVYKDSLTNLGNRRYFFQQLNQYLSKEDEFVPGFLFLINLSGLIAFNKQCGYQEGDKMIQRFSEKLTAILPEKKRFLLARLDGPDFAALIFERDPATIEALTVELYEQLNLMLKEHTKTLSCIIGVVQCTFAESPSALMERVDKTFQAAQKRGKVHYCIEETREELEKEPSSEQWEAIITQAIRSKSFNFYYQPVTSYEGVYHKECFIKLVSGDREIAAREFFSIAESYGLGYEIDLLVLEQLAKDEGADMIAMNLSASTVNDPEHQQQFLERLKHYSKQHTLKLQFEISETLLNQNIKVVQPLIKGLVDLGYTIGLDRVGATLVPFGQFKKLSLAYLKLDASLSQDLKKDKLKADFVSKLITAGNSLDIILIATAIENETQCNFLKQLGISHFQGNYIQSPSSQR